MTQETTTSPEQPDSRAPESALPGGREADQPDVSQELVAGSGENIAEPSKALGPVTDEVPKLVLFVVGSGRSGTSLFSGVMQRLGFYIPQPELVADESNPKGFGEPQWVVDYHLAMLRRLGVHPADARPAMWSRTGEVTYDLSQRHLLRDWLGTQLEQADRVLIKDPRLLWFVPLWCRVAADLQLTPRFVTLLRHPAEVVASKERWYPQLNNPPNRLAGWLNTMLYSERATRDYMRSFLAYDQLVSDWTYPIVRLDERLDLGVVRTVGLNQMQSVAQLIDPGLRRSTQEWGDLGVPTALSELADQVWGDLLALVDDDQDEAVLRRLDAARVEYGRLYGAAEAVAYSSVWAAAHRANRRRARGRRAVTAESNETKVETSRGGATSRRLAGVKQLLPESLKQTLRRRLR
jgi:hypothetical protein